MAGQTRRLRAQSTRVLAPVATDTTSGVEIAFGEFEYETNQKLIGDDRWEILAKMMHDPHVKRGISQSVQPLQNATWTWEAKTDDPEDVRQAEFLNTVLLRRPEGEFENRSDMMTASPWAAQRLYEQLSFLEHGFALFFNRYRIADGFEVIDQVWLEPHTVKKWALSEDGSLEAVERWVESPTLAGSIDNETIEAVDGSGRQNLSLYTWEFRGERFAGVPFIRSQYGAWLRKDFVQRMGAIWAQKVGAPPPIGIYSNITDDEQREFERFLRQLRGSAPAEAYFMAERARDAEHPPVEVVYPGTNTGEVDRLRGLIDGENLEMAHASGRKSQMLGETGSGSRAVGGTQARQEAKWTESIAQILISWEQHGVANLKGIAEILLERNFANPRMPELVVTGINPFEVVDNIDGIVSAGGAGIVPVKAPSVRKQVTEQLGLRVTEDELADPENYASPPSPVPPGLTSPSPSPGGGGDAPDEGDGSDEADMAAFEDMVRDLLTPMEDPPAKGGSFRGRNRLELISQTGHIEESYRVGERDARLVLDRAWDAMGRDLLQRVRSGKITPRNLESQRRSQPRQRSKMVESLEESLSGTAANGNRDVDAEVERQKAVIASGDAS